MCSVSGGGSIDMIATGQQQREGRPVEPLTDLPDLRFEGKYAEYDRGTNCQVRCGSGSM